MIIKKWGLDIAERTAYIRSVRGNAEPGYSEATARDTAIHAGN